MLNQENKKSHRVKWLEAERELAKRWVVPANAPPNQNMTPPLPPKIADPTRQKSPDTP